MKMHKWVNTSAFLLLWALVLMLTAWLYWPGISGPAMLDDRASVTVLDTLSDNPEYARDYLFGDKSGPLGRPVSLLSFVLEKLFLDEGISGGKKVNIVLHLINGCLVVWLFVLLLAHIRVPSHRWLALLAASAWLLSPLYVSTVLYVVQRMAMLAGFFMLAACICYSCWRISIIKGKIGWYGNAWLGMVFICLVLAVYSKETAIVLVPLLLLLECFWFQFRGANDELLKKLRLITLTVIAAGTVFLCLFFTIGYEWLEDSYRLRSFTPVERLLTESRILWDYVGQLMRPEVLRMGLYHDDFLVSKSLFEPKSTAYSVAAWIAVLTASVALSFWREGRFLVFAVIIFLIGHSTESTLLPLELYYEHRNYFPGIGVFLGIAVLMGYMFKKWPEVAAPILVWGGVFVLMLAMRTSSQVQIWSNAPLLYLNDVNSHPGSFRANTIMAGQLANAGALPAALDYSYRAHSAKPEEREGDYDIRDLALSCAVNETLPPDRIATLGSVNPQRPLSSVSTLAVLIKQLQDNRCPNFDRVVFADRLAAIYLEGQYFDDQGWKGRYNEKASPNMYAGLAVLENALERYENAYRYTERFLIGSPGNIKGLLMKLHFATALKKEDEVAILMVHLQSLEQSGALTVADSQTLSLYKDN